MGSGRDGTAMQEVNDTGAAELSGRNILATDEGGSDEEYEGLPPEPPKKLRVDMSQTSEQPPSRLSVPVEQKITTTGDGPNATHDMLPPEASDNDWLRLKTNRVLDHLDPDEIPDTTTKHSVGKRNERQAEPLNESANEEKFELDQRNDPVTNPDAYTEPEDIVEGIRQTSRLFVRNLPYTTTTDDIRDTFEGFGELLEVSQ